ncbi:bacillithiol biosynthesis cysteine-adding enzyme BshC [Heliorestis acidaminivorans]|uniref:bacillithiol biosynthesis cysteine-adding enzyme BshC n=1 Tax=Heliorestis acidaminivorans TaxID=553427 RepID=UPI001478A07E|nr:bacillithiol biosynthesis cysteine-adding enzyme BshC [Heliorestis acidaminivorans]
MDFQRVDSLFTGLAQAYVKREADVASLFPYDYSSLESYWRRSKWIDEYCSIPRNAVAEILVEEQHRLSLLAGTNGDDNKALEAAKNINHSQSLVVITGQQTGLFTGPHFTLLKAFTAIAHAQRLQDFLGRPVIPLFWMATEDHDFEEVSKTELAQGEKVHTIALADKRASKKPIGQLNLPEKWLETVDAFTSLLPQNDKGSEWKRFLMELSSRTSSFSDFFAVLIHRLTASYGLVIFDPMNKAFKELDETKTFYKELIKKHDSLAKELSHACGHIRSLGYEPQVEKPAQQLYLFYHHDGERKAIVKESGLDKSSVPCFQVLNSEVSFYEQELIELLQQEPTKFSSNVISRPLWQDRIFPTIAYVAGPGEIAYYASYGPIYNLMNQQMPPILPRLSVTFVEGYIGKLLNRYNSTFEDFREHADHIMAQAIKAEDKLSIDLLFDLLRSDVQESYQKIIEPLAKWDLHTGKLAEENFERVIGQINYLEKKAQQRHRQNCQEIKKHFNKLQSHLWPGGPQERILNVLPYLIKYERLTDELLEVPMEYLDSHLLLYL